MAVAVVAPRDRPHKPGSPPPDPCAQACNADVHATYVLYINCRCNEPSLHHSIVSFDTRPGQRIAHAGDVAITLTARRLPRWTRARCVSVCASRFTCGREQSLPRACKTQSAHLALHPHAQRSAMDPRAPPPRCDQPLSATWRQPRPCFT